MMGIPTPRKTVFILFQAPDVPCSWMVVKTEADKRQRALLVSLKARSRSWITPPLWTHTTGHGTLATKLGLSYWHPIILLKSLQAIWWHGTSRYNLLVPDSQKSCKDQIEVLIDYQYFSSNMATRGPAPFIAQLPDDGRNLTLTKLIFRSQ